MSGETTRERRLQDAITVPRVGITNIRLQAVAAAPAASPHCHPNGGARIPRLIRQYRQCGNEDGLATDRSLFFLCCVRASAPRAKRYTEVISQPNDYYANEYRGPATETVIRYSLITESTSESCH